MNKQLVVIVAIAAAFLGAQPAHAGKSVARLTAVSGNVLVSDDSTIASAGEALRLAPGMRVLATINSAATVEYDDGCRVRVSAGERFEVQAATPCSQGGIRKQAAAPLVPVSAR